MLVGNHEVWLEYADPDSWHQKEYRLRIEGITWPVHISVQDAINFEILAELRKLNARVSILRKLKE